MALPGKETSKCDAFKCFLRLSSFQSGLTVNHPRFCDDCHVLHCCCEESPTQWVLNVSHRSLTSLSLGRRATLRSSSTESDDHDKSVCRLRCSKSKSLLTDLLLPHQDTVSPSIHGVQIGYRTEACLALQT